MQERYVVCDVLGCCQYSIATNYFLLELQLKKGQFRTMTSVVMVQSVDDEKEVNAGRSWNHRTCWTFFGHRFVWEVDETLAVCQLCEFRILHLMSLDQSEVRGKLWGEKKGCSLQSSRNNLAVLAILVRTY